MALTFKEKELVNIGASVATGCKPCTDYHFRQVRKAGASNEEVEEAIENAAAVRDSAGKIMENHGLQHIGMGRDVEDIDPLKDTSRIKELVSIGAAFAVNCTTNLEKHVSAGRNIGIPEEDIQAVLDSALFIKGEAAHYAEQIVSLQKKKDELQELLDELQATQAQLVQSEKMAALGKLVAGVVHEMNTPIGAINSATDISKRSVDKILSAFEASQTPDEIKQNQQLQDSLKALKDSSPVTLAASDRLLTVFKSLKSFVSLDSAQFQTVCLHDSLETVLTLLDHEFKDNIKIVKEFGEIPMIQCCPGDINQVFMNLITNAAHAIKGNGTITLRTSANKENVQVDVIDTGEGIPPEQLQGLFEPNFTKTESRVKVGLGLFTSYNIVQNHRGEIKVDTKLGEGSTFTVILPKNPGVRGKPCAKEGSGKVESRCSRLQ